MGYEEAGQLTEAVRRRPYSVVLLDEIEKAHPDVFNLLLQVMDDGRLTDAQGRTVDFKNTVLIMTSNLGAELIMAHPGEAAAGLRGQLMRLLQRASGPSSSTGSTRRSSSTASTPSSSGRSRGCCWRRAGGGCTPRTSSSTWTAPRSTGWRGRDTSRSSGAAAAPYAPAKDRQHALPAASRRTLKPGQRVHVGVRDGDLAFTVSEEEEGAPAPGVEPHALVAPEREEGRPEERVQSPGHYL